MERFRKMVEKLPGGYLAIRTGQASRLLVIDAESYAKNEGEDTGLQVLDEWETWVEGGWSLPRTRSVRTPGGGLHLFYRIPDGVVIKSGRILPNVDVKGESGYVGAPFGLDSREWIDWNVSVADAPHELIAWLAGTRRMSFGRGGGVAGHSEGYDYELFAREGCPDGHRDEFFNDLLFRLRKKGISRERYDEAAYGHWLRCSQPPEARYEMPWEDVAYKLNYVWNTVDPDSFTPPWSFEAGGNGRGPAGTSAATLPGESQDGDAGSGEGSGLPPNGGQPRNEPPLGSGDNEHPTESGNAARFVRLFRGKWLFIPGGVGWHRWTGIAWEPDQTNLVFHDTLAVVADIRDQALAEQGDAQDRWVRHATTSESMNYRNAALRGASAHPLMNVTYDRLNTDPYLLVVNGGTLDLKTQRIRDSVPEDLNTQVANVTYDQDAQCPHWLEHIELVTRHRDGTPDPELANFIQRWCGYTLTGLVQEQKFFFGYGEGQNGKNTIIETLVGILGTYAMTGSSKLLLGNGQEHETIIADLAGARMAFVDETPKGRINESRIKQLTGSGRMRARKIAKDSFEFDARFKLWIAGNNKPRVADTSEGFWRRLDLVPFDVQIPVERRVKDYGSVLRPEWPGILNWALDGLRAYLEVGLEPPTRVAVARSEYRETENSFAQFVAETFDRSTDTGKGVWIPNKVIHWLYRQWCYGEGIDRVPSMQQLAGDLERNHFIRDGKVRRIQWGVGLGVTGTKVERGWIGPPIIIEVPSELVWREN